MRRLVFALLLILPACIPADAKPICGIPHKPPCPTTTTPTPPPPTTTIPTPTPTTTTTPPPPPSTDKRIAVLLINFTGDPRQPWTTTFIDSLYDGPAPSLHDFYTRSSFGQLDVSADVFGWFTIAAPVTPCNMANTRNQADAAATAAGVALSLYTHKQYVWPDNTTQGSCQSGAEWPGDQSSVALQTTCTPTACTARSGLTHEFGHNLGMDHAGGPSGAYGDGFDVMGCCPNALLSNIHRLQMGWIPPAQVITITTSQTVTLAPVNLATSDVYRIPNGNDFIYLENRAERTVYENGMGEVWTGGMLLIRVAPDYTVFTPTPSGPAYPATLLLDGTPGSIFDQPGLPVGASLTVGSVTITNQAFDGTNNTVEIAL